jgi:hypothetical protein
LLDKELVEAVEKLTKQHFREKEKLNKQLETAIGYLQKACFHPCENRLEELGKLPLGKSWWCAVCGLKLDPPGAQQAKIDWNALVQRHNHAAQGGNPRGGGGGSTFTQDESQTDAAGSSGSGSSKRHCTSSRVYHHESGPA